MPAEEEWSDYQDADEKMEDKNLWLQNYLQSASAKMLNFMEKAAFPVMQEKLLP